MVILALLLLGLCFGSFVNALVWRIHEQESKRSKKSSKGRDMSIVHGRSMCPNCKHPLAAKDLIPVLSWLQLRGKCRYCHKKFDDTPISELLTPTLFIFSYIYWPFAYDNRGKFLFVMWLIFIVGFVAMVIYDARWYILPNRIVYPMLALAAAQALAVIFIFHGGVNSALGASYGLLIGGGIFYLIFQISSGNWIGGGDVKLGAVLGLIVGGPLASLLLLFIASCLGSLVAIPLLLLGKAKRSTRLPFGPFLIAASIIVYLFGSSMIAWYKHLLLV